MVQTNIWDDIMVQTNNNVSDSDVIKRSDTGK